MKQQIGLIAITFILLIALAQLAVASETAMVKTNDYEPIKAKVVSDVPSEFTINVKFLTNTFADTDAPIFAVYTSSTKPENCADFRQLKLSYEKPSKYLRVFDLSENEEVIAAVNKHQCVVIPNVPADTAVK